MKNSTISKKLAAYSALGAAFIALNGEKSDGQIIYHDVNPDLDITKTTPVYLDLNGDSIEDFELQRFESGSRLFFRESIQEQLLGSGSVAGGNVAGAYSLGSVKSYMSWEKVPLKLYSTHCVVSSGYKVSQCGSDSEWFNQDHYLLFRLKLLDGFHYGWMRFDYGKILKDYAYESKPDVRIQPGQIDDCDTVKVQITTPGPYPSCLSNVFRINTNPAFVNVWLLNGKSTNIHSDTFAFQADYSTPGTYQAVSSSVGCSDTTQGILVYNHSHGTATITRHADTLSSNYKFGNQWYYGCCNVTIPGATNQKYGILRDNTYYLQDSDSVGCLTPFVGLFAKICSEYPAHITTGSDSTCYGKYIFLTAPIGYNYFYYWYKNDVLQSAEGQQDYYWAESTGDYSVVVLNNFYCLDTSAKLHLELPQAFHPIISRNGNILSSSYAEGNQWLLNGQTVFGATSQDYVATKDGYYQVKVLNDDGCIGISDSLQVIVSGIDAQDYQPLINVFYKNDFIYVHLPQELASSEVFLFDELGILREKIFKADTENKFSTAGSAPCIYFIRIRKGNRIWIKKVSTL